MRKFSLLRRLTRFISENTIVKNVMLVLRILNILLGEVLETKKNIMTSFIVMNAKNTTKRDD